MRVQSMIIACTLLLVGSSALAHDAFGDITMSTDPARAAAVEQHAHELALRRTTMPAQREGHGPHAHKHGKRHHERHHEK